MQEIHKLLNDLYSPLKEVANEAIGKLGKEKALIYIDIFNDWINISGEIKNQYADTELINSLLYLSQHSLMKDIYWIQLFFLTGNYPQIYRSLRYILEMSFKGYYMDTYDKHPRKNMEHLANDIDVKRTWVYQNEMKLYGGKFLSECLLELFPQAKVPEVMSSYKNIWETLNKHVHPTIEYLDRTMIGVPGFAMINTFDDEWANETISISVMVFDLVWLAIISTFPNCAEKLANNGLHLTYPIVSSALEIMNS
jgi:hypothetical protein